ncbi:hypothetical protein B9L19_03500 [Geobacillus thermocatenulatus]|uniref:Uncharacterized protein n=2 Tax=Geobacillus thermoleovorans group TaxID=1505648 RepID=A0A226QCS3_9BACL|nr:MULTISPECIES: hypothetical protein [Geobacillus thermoleovorans group]ASS98397.1 hypothetical protein GT3921_04635 [Geobacillus thermocatenulatus]MED4974251.1 hypothetical protein [Geobacillus thermoleovorans]OXB89159.1 hypothetical protein B9L19_03500 [Geobacillus thermocatenulatus]
MKKRAPFIMMLVLLFSLCLGSISAFANGMDEVKYIEIPPSDKAGMKKVWSKMGTDGEYLKVEFKLTSGNESSDKRILVYDEANGVIKFNSKNFDDATDKSRKKALGIFVDALQNSPVSLQTQQNIINTMSTANEEVSKLLVPLLMDTAKADVYTAMRWVKPIIPVIQVIFGIGAVIISILLIGSTVIDLVFIGLPIAREAILDNRSEKSGRVKFISSDAEAVIKEVESSLADNTGRYKNAYLTYFKRRALTYIILSICLLYLVMGELGNLIAWLLSLGEGVV